LSNSQDVQKGSIVEQSKHSSDPTSSLDQPGPQEQTLPTTSSPYESSTVNSSLSDQYLPLGSTSSHFSTQV